MQWIKTFEKKYGGAVVREELILDRDGEVLDRVEAVTEIRGYQSERVRVFLVIIHDSR